MALHKNLYNASVAIIVNKIDEVNKIINEIQEAIANETKSSAGDKYETSREMLQQEINRETSRLIDLEKTKSVLDNLEIAENSDSVRSGSIVFTDKGNYFIAVSAGVITHEGIRYHSISSLAPIAIKFMGKKTGDQITVNDRQVTIEKIL